MRRILMNGFSRSKPLPARLRPLASVLREHKSASSLRPTASRFPGFASSPHGWSNTRLRHGHIHVAFACKGFEQGVSFSILSKRAKVASIHRGVKGPRDFTSPGFLGKSNTAPPTQPSVAAPAPKSHQPLREFSLALVGNFSAHLPRENRQKK